MPSSSPARALARTIPSVPAIALLAALGAVALAGAPAARAEAPVIYKWVDENGVAHYTTDRGRIPSAIRDRVVQGGEAARGADWLRRDAGPAGVSPAPLAPGAAISTTPSEREASDVELPEESDGVHAVQDEPDWSQAPGGEATWAPSDLGEEGQKPAAATAAPAPPPVEAPPAAAPVVEEVQETAARTPEPPPPPPPPLESDAVPVAVEEAPAPSAPAVVVPEQEPATVAATPVMDEGPPFDEAAPTPIPEPEAAEPEPAVAEEPLVLESAPEATRAAAPALEPSAPAAVASPAPLDLGPDEQAEVAALDAQIAEMEARIASDEEALMVLISDDESTPRDALVDDPQFRDIAQRLPKLQADLERLRERRAQIQPVVSHP